MAWLQSELELLSTHGSKMTAAQLSQQLGKSKNAIFKMASKLGVQLARRRGERKFSDEEIAYVRQLLSKSTFTHKQIGEKTGISTSYVSQIAIGARPPSPEQSTKSASNSNANFSKYHSTLNSIFRI